MWHQDSSQSCKILLIIFEICELFKVFLFVEHDSLILCHIGVLQKRGKNLLYNVSPLPELHLILMQFTAGMEYKRHVPFVLNVSSYLNYSYFMNVFVVYFNAILLLLSYYDSFISLYYYYF